jgi:hypothetical protein
MLAVSFASCVTAVMPSSFGVRVGASSNGEIYSFRQEIVEVNSVSLGCDALRIADGAGADFGPFQSRHHLGENWLSFESLKDDLLTIWQMHRVDYSQWSYEWPHPVDHLLGD